MLTRLMGSQKTTSILLLCLIIMGTFFWAGRQTQAATVPASIMYFIPHNTADLDSSVTPQAMRRVDVVAAGYRHVREVGFTSDWQVIRNLAAQNELDGLIIHAAAMERVDWQELQTWFLERDLVVAGIEITGDQLADLLGVPSLAMEPVAGINFDYHIYSVKLSGHVDDIQRLAAVGYDNDGVEDIRFPLTFDRRSSRGSFAEGGLFKFLGQLDGHLIAKNPH